MRGGGQHGDGEHEEERQARARACLLGDTSLHRQDEQPPDTPRHTQTLSSRAGGETARYLAVVAVVAVDCLFVDELTTPLSTKAKLCVYIGI